MDDRGTRAPGGPRRGTTLRRALSTPGVLPRVRALGAWWARTRVARTAARYSGANGGLLASGMALTTLLSLTAALTLGWTVLTAVLGRDSVLRRSVLDAIDAALPGLVGTPSSPGLVDPDALVSPTVWTPTSVLALLVMVWTAMGLVGSMGSSIRAMFAVAAVPRPVWDSAARNLLGALGCGAAVVAGAGLAVLVDLFGSWTSRVLGLAGGGQVGLRIASHVVGAAAWAGVTLLLVRVVAGVHVPRRDLAWGTAGVAVASAVLRVAGTTVVGSVSGPLLTTATTLVTLVLWIALQVRVLLTACAWMADPPPAPQRS